MKRMEPNTTPWGTKDDSKMEEKRDDWTTVILCYTVHI